MTAKQFYDWQTAGGADDVTRLVACLEQADVPWCTFGGIAVSHWAGEPMVTRDLDFVVAAEAIEPITASLLKAGFVAERFEWSINFRGHSKVSIQLSTAECYREFPARGVAADVHGILLRVACLEDTLTGKLLAWQDSTRRQSKKLKDMADIARLVESHPALWPRLPPDLQAIIKRPA